MMDNDIVERFGARYAAAFYSSRFLSKRGRDLYFRLMIIEDTLAGPLYAIQSGADLEYVYQDREGRFLGVSDPDTFRDWALDLARDFEQRVQAFQPKTK